MKAADLDDFTLLTVQDMTPTIDQWWEDMHDVHGPSTRFLAHASDIKEMFTNLPHEEIIKAIDFIISRAAASRRGRRKFVRVERRPRGTVEFGKADPHLLSQFITLSFQEVRDICVTDIHSCYFKSLGIYILQIVGVPMGSPGSSNLAIAHCAYAEHQFSSSIRDFLPLMGYRHSTSTKLFRFMRYVDDVLGVVAYDCRSHHSLEAACAILHFLKHHAYHKNLILKEEPTEGWFAFLEAKLCIPHAGPFHIQFNNKNLPSFADTGKLKFLRIQNRASFMSKRDATTRISGALHRLRRTALRPHARVANTLEMALVYAAQGYPLHLFGDALDNMSKKLNEPIWTALRTVIGHITTNTTMP